MRFRRRVYLTLDPTEKGGIAERIFEILLIVIILLNILAIILSSVKEIDQKYDAYFRDFEIFSLVFFTDRIHRTHLLNCRKTVSTVIPSKADCVLWLLH